MKKIVAMLMAFAMLFPMMVVVNAEQTNVYFVSPNGNDENDGSIDAPFKTPEKAKQAVRSLIAAGSLPQGGVTVYFREGYYEFLKQGFKLTDSDSGTEKSPITYSAYNGEKVVFCGGPVLEQKDFKRTTDEKVLNRIYDENARPFIYQYDLSDMPADAVIFNADQTADNAHSKETPNELICDDEYQTSARWPNLDENGDLQWVLIEEVVQANINNTKFSYKLNDIYSDRVSYWKKADWGSMYAHGLIIGDWLDSRVGVESIRNGVITTSSLPSFGTPAKGRTLYFYNLLPELDRPGEFYIDAENKILYYYPSLESHENSKFVITTLDDYLCDVSASNVTFKGITFNGSRGNGIIIREGENTVFDFCKVLNTAGTGVQIGKSQTEVDAVNCGIRNSEIRHVSVGCLVYAGDMTNIRKANCFIENCCIYDFSQRRFTYDPALNIGGCGNRALNNTVSYGAHMAIWSDGVYNEIAYNDVSNVLRETADSGAIYMNNGIQRLGNEIHNNHIHDCKLNPLKKDSAFGIRAFYFDDYESGKIAYNNLVTNFEGYGLLLNGGSFSELNNNVIYNTKHAPVTIHDGPAGTRLEFSTESSENRIKNMATALKKYEGDSWEEQFPFLKDIWGSNIGEFKGNVAKRNVAVDTPDFKFDHVGNDYQIIVQDNVKLNAEDVFVDAENGDFRIKKDAKVYDVVPEFEDIEFEKMGYYTEKATTPVKNSIVLGIDRSGVLSNNKLSLIDSDNYLVKPIIQEDKTFVPLRFIAESLGVNVDWNSETNTATLSGNGKTVVFTIGQSTYTINGEEKSLEAAPRVINDRTFIPLRDCAETFDKSVAWNGKGLIVIGDKDTVFDDIENENEINFLLQKLDI